MTITSNRAKMAQKWMLAPLVVLVVGAFLVNTSSGWNTLGYFFMFLAFGGVLSLIPISLGISAIKTQPEQKDMAFIAIVIPIIMLLTYVAIGSIEWK
jgi:hypothetical protein